MSYVVQTSEFEGPLDALVSLIEKRKLLINDISLAQVTEGYISYLNSLERRPIANLSDFISVASTLLLIKSKSLLPELDLSYEEEFSIDELKNRLKRYEQLREKAQVVEALYGKHPIFLAKKPIHKEPLTSIPENLSKQSLNETLQNVLSNLPKFPKKPKTHIKPVVSLKEVIERIQNTIEGGFSTSFKDFVGKHPQEKHTIIVNFIALLELVKQGILEVEQKQHFEDITMESKQVATPRYG